MVSIITVNYRGGAVTCELIDSLKKFEEYPYEIIVVDNDSSNGDPELLRRLYPDVKVVCSDKNLGFAGGNNLGYRYAEGDYILYLNNDITIMSPFLERLVNRLQQSGVGAVSPKIRYEHTPEMIQYAGYTALSPIALRNNLVGVNQIDRGQFDEPRQTSYVHGAAMMTSRALIERVGLMTEVYFLFYEELDWSMRIREAGYTLWYEPSSVVYHKESRSVVRGSAMREYYLTRSRVIFARRNNSDCYKILSCGYQLFVVMPKNVVKSLVRGDWEHVKAYAKGCYDGLRHTLRDK